MAIVAYPTWSIYEPLFAIGNRHFGEALKDVEFRSLTEEELIKVVRRMETDIAFIPVTLLPYIRGYHRIPWGAWFKTEKGVTVLSHEQRDITALEGLRVGLRDRWATSYILLSVEIRNFWPIIRSPMVILDDFKKHVMDALLVDFIPDEELPGLVPEAYVIGDLVERWVRRMGYPVPFAVGIVRSDVEIQWIDDLAQLLRARIQQIRQDFEAWSEEVTASVPLLAEREIKAFGDYTRWDLMLDGGPEVEEALVVFYEKAFEKGCLPKPDEIVLNLQHSAGLMT